VGRGGRYELESTVIAKSALPYHRLGMDPEARACACRIIAALPERAEAGLDRGTCTKNCLARIYAAG